MPATPHVERHFRGSARLRDVVIGMADGLTVPFALAAGLSGALAASRVVVTAGLAEIAAGALAMGLGGFLAARSDAEHYESERRREQVELVEKAHHEFAEVKAILEGYGLTAAESVQVTAALQQRPEAMVDFMMRFELGLERPEPGRAWKSALTIAASYVLGGLVPLAPYFAFSDARAALPGSAAVTGVALFAFGLVKGHLTGAPPLRSGLQTLGIGALAALAAYGIARAISG